MNVTIYTKDLESIHFRNVKLIAMTYVGNEKYDLDYNLLRITYIDIINNNPVKRSYTLQLDKISMYTTSEGD